MEGLSCFFSVQEREDSGATERGLRWMSCVPEKVIFALSTHARVPMCFSSFTERTSLRGRWRAALGCHIVWVSHLGIWELREMVFEQSQTGFCGEGGDSICILTESYWPCPLGLGDLEGAQDLLYVAQGQKGADSHAPWLPPTDWNRWREGEDEGGGRGGGR